MPRRPRPSGRGRAVGTGALGFAPARAATRGFTGNNAPARPYQHEHKHVKARQCGVTTQLPSSLWHVCKARTLTTLLDTRACDQQRNQPALSEEALTLAAVRTCQKQGPSAQARAQPEQPEAAAAHARLVVQVLRQQRGRARGRGLERDGGRGRLPQRLLRRRARLEVYQRARARLAPGRPRSRADSLLWIAVLWIAGT
jgi:hypothetical protein